jgi:hypothetical protein
MSTISSDPAEGGAAIRSAIDQLRELRAELRLDGLNVRDLMEEGRRS